MKSVFFALALTFTCYSFALNDKDRDIRIFLRVDFSNESAGKGIIVMLVDKHNQLFAEQTSNQEGMVLFEHINKEEFEVMIEDPMGRFHAHNRSLSPPKRMYEITEHLRPTELYVDQLVRAQWAAINLEYPSAEEISKDSCNSVMDPDFASYQERMTSNILAQVTYPQYAIENNEQGRVELKFIIETDGRITNVEITKHATSSLDIAASQLLLSIGKMTPRLCGNRTVRTIGRIPIAYTLN